MEKNSVVRIGISGSYGGLNLGDEAILHSIISQIRKSIPAEITVFTRNSTDSLKRHNVDRAISTRNLARSEIVPAIERLDILVIGGGGILYDGDAKVYAREAMIAFEKNIPVMVYAVGAGPLKDPSTIEMVKILLDQAAVVTVRDHISSQILEDIGVKREIIITADPALLLTSESIDSNALKKEGFLDKKRIIGMSVRETSAAAPDIKEEHYHGLLANAADYMIERFDADVVFIPMEWKEFDLQHSHAVISRMLRPQRATVLQGSYSSGQVLSIIKNLEFAVGMRLHFLIFSAIQGIPFVALPYSPKVAGFLGDFGIEMPPIHLVDEGRLMAYIDKAWDNRKSLQEKIKNHLPALKERAATNNTLLINLIKRKTGG